MPRTKGAKDKKSRKRETKVRNTLGYFKRYSSDFNFSEEKLEIKMLWKQLDYIRGVPSGKVVGRRYIHLSPSRSRVVQRRPVPAIIGRYAHFQYTVRVSKFLNELGLGDRKDKDFLEWIWDLGWAGIIHHRKILKGQKPCYQNTLSPDSPYYELQQYYCMVSFCGRVLWTNICRMMEKENEELAQKRPIKTEKEIAERLRQLGVFVPD